MYVWHVHWCATAIPLYAWYPEPKLTLPGMHVLHIHPSMLIHNRHIHHMTRVWRYIGKIYHENEDTLPKNMLRARIKELRKEGQPQISCRKNFIAALNKVLINFVLNAQMDSDVYDLSVLNTEKLGYFHKFIMGQR